VFSHSSEKVMVATPLLAGQLAPALPGHQPHEKVGALLLQSAPLRRLFEQADVDPAAVVALITGDLAAVRAHGLRFDEALPLYAWYEDIDFTRALGHHGAILRLEGARGVHLGVKTARTPGFRLGYSQVVNPVYLARKGTFPWNHAIPSAARHCAMNLARSLWPEPEVDRWGRFRGNLMGLWDLLRGRAAPSRILSL
jgi:GT2 family glycosyltransferase